MYFLRLTPATAAFILMPPSTPRATTQVLQSARFQFILQVLREQLPLGNVELMAIVLLGEGALVGRLRLMKLKSNVFAV